MCIVHSCPRCSWLVVFRLMAGVCICYGGMGLRVLGLFCNRMSRWIYVQAFLRVEFARGSFVG